MRKTREQKGITLVALIITIIVLLILAVVTIAAVQDGGIIQYAQNAKTEYEEAVEREEEMLQSYLDDLRGNNPNGGNGDEPEGFEAITALDYGDAITYSVDLNGDGNLTNDWKVFYKDDTHLYIIASDYLANTSLPKGLKMSTYDGYPYSAYWATDGSSFTSTGSATIRTEVANKYKLSWLIENNASTSYNARATGDLLNVEAWTEKFGNAEKGIEAIGAPTIEMWVASWNESGYTPLYTAYDEVGYYVGNTENPTSTYIYVSSDTVGHADTLYFPYTAVTENCNGYWLASPSASASNYGLCVDYIGRVRTHPHGHYYYAVRPLVSLPSDVITTNADGSLEVAQ